MRKSYEFVKYCGKSEGVSIALHYAAGDEGIGYMTVTERKNGMIAWFVPDRSGELRFLPAAQDDSTREIVLNMSMGDPAGAEIGGTYTVDGKMRRFTLRRDSCAENALGDGPDMLMKQIQETIMEVQTAPTLNGRRDAAENLAALARRIDPWKVDEKTFNDLVSLMDSPDDSVRRGVAASIGFLGERAKPAAPKLLEILPKVDCLDGAVTSADTIRTALERIGVRPPPRPDCIRNAG